MLRAVLLTVGACHRGQAPLGHDGLVPKRDVPGNVFASGASRTNASQLWRSKQPLRGKEGWPTRSETASLRIALGTAASEHSTKPRWQHYATCCPMHSSCNSGGIRNHAASDHSAQLLWLCPAKFWSAIADWRHDQAPVTYKVTQS